MISAKDAKDLLPKSLDERVTRALQEINDLVIKESCIGCCTLQLENIIEKYGIIHYDSGIDDLVNKLRNLGYKVIIKNIHLGTMYCMYWGPGC